MTGIALPSVPYIYQTRPASRFPNQQHPSTTSTTSSIRSFVENPALNLHHHQRVTTTRWWFLQLPSTLHHHQRVLATRWWSPRPPSGFCPPPPPTSPRDSLVARYNHGHTTIFDVSAPTSIASTSYQHRDVFTTTPTLRLEEIAIKLVTESAMSHVHAEIRRVTELARRRSSLCMASLVV